MYLTMQTWDKDSHGPQVKHRDIAFPVLAAYLWQQITRLYPPSQNQYLLNTQIMLQEINKAVYLGAVILKVWVHSPIGN